MLRICKELFFRTQKLNYLNGKLYHLDYDNKVNLSSVITNNKSTYIPQKPGIITCKIQSTASNGGLDIIQHGVTIMFANAFQQYSRVGCMCIVDDSQISVTIFQNIKVEELYYIPFR